MGSAFSTEGDFGTGEELVAIVVSSNSRLGVSVCFGCDSSALGEAVFSATSSGANPPAGKPSGWEAAKPR